MEEGGRGGENMRMEERGVGEGALRRKRRKCGQVDEWKSSRVEKSRTGSRRIENCCWCGRAEAEGAMAKQQSREYGPKQQSREYGQHQRE